jgi:hypothetical protein
MIIIRGNISKLFVDNISMVTSADQINNMIQISKWVKPRRLFGVAQTAR